MSERELLTVLGLAGALLIAASALLWRLVLLEQRVVARLAEVQSVASSAPSPAPVNPLAGVVQALVWLGRLLARPPLFSPRTIAELRETLVVNGFRGERALAVFLGAKVFAVIVIPLAFWFGFGASGADGLALTLVTVLGAIIGLLLPDAVVRRLRQRYLAQLERGLPDGLDMMVICAEAGLGMETALARVAEEMRPANPVVAEEFRLTLAEMAVLNDRRQALLNLGERTGLDTLKRFSSTLVQALQYGTPLATALRTLAAEMRQDALTRFEARAARLPVLLTMPLVFFILPTVFLVVAGPAVLSVLRLP